MPQAGDVSSPTGQKNGKAKPKGPTKEHEAEDGEASRSFSRKAKGGVEIQRGTGKMPGDATKKTRGLREGSERIAEALCTGAGGAEEEAKTDPVCPRPCKGAKNREVRSSKVGEQRALTREPAWLVARRIVGRVQPRGGKNRSRVQSSRYCNGSSLPKRGAEQPRRAPPFLV